MRIVSWNVNGLAACVRKGFYSFIGQLRPDICCIQEVRSKFPLNLPEYPYQYWNLAKRKGYSGTLLLSRNPPLSCANGLGIKRFDDEGRIITAEYSDYFVINVYVPNVNTASKPYRAEYRIAWNKAFCSYVESLGKPVIICGDLNVAHRYIDIYPENHRNNAMTPAHFDTEERSGFERLLSTGLTDVYRSLYPFQTGAYTWWGPKNMSRGVNRGSRLDYFLISDELLSGVRDITHHTNVYGSDHCPISLRYVPSSNPYMAPQEELARQWKMIDWDAAEENLESLQHDLAQAAHNRNWHLIRELQNEIARSPEAKALAVKKVAEAGKAAGIDGVRLKTDAQKMQVVQSMATRQYLTRPMRSVPVKDKRKVRNAEIPVVRDKAMMTLYKFLLDPVAEELLDKRAFGGRKKRSTLDAFVYLFDSLSEDNAPEWVIQTDIAAYYDSIIHRELIKCVPMDRKMTEKFLKTGIIKSGELFSKDQGISIASPLSGTFGNLLLRGIQSYIYDHLYPKGKVDYANGCVTSFADDMIVLARTKSEAIQILNYIKDFLEARGLVVKQEKTLIVHITEGFDFLSWHFQKRNGVIKAWPSLASVHEIKGELDELIQEHKGTQRDLIEKLNRKLSGWAWYFRISESQDTFRDIDTTVEALLLKRMSRRYPRWHRDTIKEKLWTKEDNFPVFALPEDHSVRVVRLAEIRQVSHEPVNLRYDPYLDPDYYAALKARRDQSKATGKYREVWKRQEGKCAICGSPILFDQEFQVVEKNLGKGRGVKNLQYIHTYCNYDIFNDALQLRGEGINTLEILEELSEPSPPSDSPYYELTRFFHFCDDTIVVLTFAQIEKITGMELGYEAHLYDAFWYDDVPGRNSILWEEEKYPFHAIDAPPREYCICDSWLTQGYEIKDLDRLSKRVVFRQIEQNVSAIIFPKELREYKVPTPIAQRVNRYLANIKKECGFK